MSMDKSAIEAIQSAHAVEEVARQIGEFEVQHPLVAVAGEVGVQSLESYLSGRVRMRGTMKTQDLGAFIDYTEGKAKNDLAYTFVSTEKMEAVSIFNLGTEEKPGHGDDTAVLNLPVTAEMKFLYLLSDRAHDHRGKLSQLQFAEMVEEWRDYMTLFHDFAAVQESTASTLGQALAAIRKVDIKSSRDQSSSEGEHSRQRSDMEKVEIQSNHLPGFICFRCVPYNGLEEREFWIRVTTHLEGSAPTFSLRVIRLELEEQRMREELFDKLNMKLGVLLDDAAKVSLHRGNYSLK